MKRRALLFAAGIALAAAGSTRVAEAAPARRVVVAGPEDDALAARVQKELTALGFETSRLGALDGCARSAVVVAARDLDAVAAACSDGDQVGVWVAEGGTLRLRDVVVVLEEGDPGRETTAVRAAEVARATIAMRDAEEEAARAKPAPPASLDQPGDWETFDQAPAPTPPREKAANRAPTFLVAAGTSALMGVDATALAFSGKAEIGVLKHVTAGARIEYPLDTVAVGGGSALLVAPAFAGVGIGIPVTGPDAFLIPRFGAGFGLAWIKATRPASQSFDMSGPIFGTTRDVSDSTSAFAVQVDAGLSMRIYRSLRIAADGVLGSTTSRLVVRDRGANDANWGAPFGALALRLELMIQ